MTSSRVVSRRTLIAGGVASAGAIAAGCAPDVYDGVQPDEVYATRVPRLPADDPDSPLWERTPLKNVAMGPQDIALPLKTQPSIAELRVHALHDDTSISFRLEWDDPDASDLTLRVDDYRDACAVLFAPGRGDPAMRMMGNATRAATLLQWKADWQRDVEQGVQTLDAVYPNRCVDTYPPLRDSVPGDVTAASYTAAGATEWLPGMHVGNPFSASVRASCVEKAIAYGFSTVTPTAHQDATGRGARTSTGWRVVITKPLAPTGPDEQPLTTGGAATCAFAVWSGTQHDAGGRKTPSAAAYRLTIGE